MSLMFLVDDAIDIDFVVRLLLLLLIMMMTSTIQRFVFYMPLLAVGEMTYSYFLGPTYYRSGM